MQKTLKSHGTWIGKWTFVLAATGSAVGLGNIWGFPYKAGTCLLYTSPSPRD